MPGHLNLPVPNAGEVATFKAIYAREFGIDLSDAQALDLATRIVKIVYLSDLAQRKYEEAGRPELPHAQVPAILHPMTSTIRMGYAFTAEDANQFNKHGIDLTVYGEGVPSANVVHVSVKEGHFQEFYDEKSTYMYYIVSGEGTFMLNDEPTPVKTTDLLVVPPTTRIHYFGTMEMVLTVSPAFDEKNEHHVRYVEKSENPYRSAGRDK